MPGLQGSYRIPYVVKMLMRVLNPWFNVEIDEPKKSQVIIQYLTGLHSYTVLKLNGPILWKCVQLIKSVQPTV